ncbi:PIN domain-containing protein [Paratractidigestivibacter sp.]|uniref:PIN domain-containing protein n=1 Tax=Paratractidigestivibacter sp. TaxID=2847316 RepID=UPI002ACB0EDD|nr:PIN domain-containing protein [Paratractidigestivibacter sp.]
MDCYLIDYENVGAKGVESLARLKDGDRAVIFYSGANHAIDLGVIARLGERLAGVCVYEAHVGTPNALDFQLACELGRLAERHGTGCAFHIVSNDKGFDCLSSYLAERGCRVDRVGVDLEKPKATVLRGGAAKAAAAPRGGSGKRAAAAPIPGLEKDDRPGEVAGILSTTRGKSNVNVALCRLYRDTKHAGRVYKIIKDRIVA